MDARDHERDAAKKRTRVQPESLFSIALYDHDPAAFAHYDFPSSPVASQTPLLLPADEYRDVSIRDLLNVSGDYLFGNVDPMVNAGTTMDLGMGHTSSVDPASVVSSATRSFLHFQSPPSPFRHDIAPPPLSPLPTPPSPREILSAPCLKEGDLELPTPSIEAPPKKKRRSSPTFSENDGEDGPTETRFRSYQSEQWQEKFNELCQYREQNGHCVVPHTYEENLPLARWVKRQRYQYKLLMEGRSSSTMTHERIKTLEDIGFVWDSQGSAWGERLNELREFKLRFSNCNVPSQFAENPQLATWVKCQRRQYKLHQEGKPSNMTQERITVLNNLGFEWELRSIKKSKSCSSHK